MKAQCTSFSKGRIRDWSEKSSVLVKHENNNWPVLNWQHLYHIILFWTQLSTTGKVVTGVWIICAKTSFAGSTTEQVRSNNKTQQMYLLHLGGCSSKTPLSIKYRWKNISFIFGWVLLNWCGQFAIPGGLDFPSPNFVHQRLSEFPSFVSPSPSTWWLVFWLYFGFILVVFWLYFGFILVVFWLCFGCVWIASLLYSAVFPVFGWNTSLHFPLATSSLFPRSPVGVHFDCISIVFIRTYTYLVETLLCKFPLLRLSCSPSLSPTAFINLNQFAPDLACKWNTCWNIDRF